MDDEDSGANADDDDSPPGYADEVDAEVNVEDGDVSMESPLTSMDGDAYDEQDSFINDLTDDGIPVE